LAGLGQLPAQALPNPRHGAVDKKKQRDFTAVRRAFFPCTRIAVDAKGFSSNS
jgi:hypothetical protein